MLPPWPLRWASALASAKALAAKALALASALAPAALALQAADAPVQSPNPSGFLVLSVSHEKNPCYIPLYWLVYRDPYNGSL